MDAFHESHCQGIHFSLATRSSSIFDLTTRFVSPSTTVRCCLDHPTGPEVSLGSLAARVVSVGCDGVRICSCS